MKLLRRLRYWLRARADLAEEIEFHRAMGNTTRAREDARAVWIWPWLESVMQDVRYALRNLRAHPGFTSVVIRPWPVADPGRAVDIFASSGQFVGHRCAPTAARSSSHAAREPDAG